MRHFARRSVFAMPALVLAGVAKAAPLPVPPFHDWIGRTARLRGSGGAARLLLAEDGTGRLSVSLLLFCQVLPVRAWRLGPDGASLTYSRVAALDSSRLIAGEARILPGAQRLLWVEAEPHEAEFESFEAADAIGRCG